MGRIWCTWLSTLFFCINRSSPSQNLFGEYLLIHIMFDTIHIIAASSSLLAYILQFPVLPYTGQTVFILVIFLLLLGTV